jgi:hypothetical protein
VPIQVWTAMLMCSGFVEVTATEIAAEAAIEAGQRLRRIPPATKSSGSARASLDAELD